MQVPVVIIDIGANKEWITDANSLCLREAAKKTILKDGQVKVEVGETDAG